jgi:Tol biopolymer transport system component
MPRTLLLTLVLLLALPAAARATLVFDRDPLKPAVWVAADDGSGARKLASGRAPRISPDGKWVVYSTIADSGDGYRPDLMVVPADGSAAPRLLARGWQDPFTFAWSPDSTTLATGIGPEIGAKRLALITVATGVRHTVASGFFGGASFAPDGATLLYSRYPHSTYPPKTDLYAVSVAAGAAATAPKLLTTDHRSQTPLFSPAATVVTFVKLVDAKRRRYGPKSELYVMAPDGSGVRRLTTTKVDPLLFGLEPTDFSADGTRLLAEFTGQDTSYAVTVDPLTGRHKPVAKATESGFVGTALSADGTTILGATGGYDPDSRHDVVTIPYAGGTPTLLARNAADPDWTR